MPEEVKPPATPAVEPAEEVSTLDRVHDILNAPEEVAAKPAEQPPVAEAPKPGQPPAPEAAKPGEPAKPAEQPIAGPFKVGEEAKFKISDTAVTTREDIDKLPYANDATFKAIMGEFEQLAQFKQGIAEALNDGPYKITDADTMKSVVRDAFDLYDIINLKTSPAGLFDLAAKNYGEENINQVIASILIYAKEKGITIEQYSDLSKPENKRLFDLSKESSQRRATEARTQTENAQRAEAQQKEKDFATLETNVKKWAKENAVAEEDTLDYLTYVVAQIGGDQKQLQALRDGKFGEVERILTEYNNRMIDRQSRWEKALTARKQGREKQLQGAAPAGGTPAPVEPKQKKVNVLDDDERMDAVKAALRG